MSNVRATSSSSAQVRRTQKTIGEQLGSMKAVGVKVSRAYTEPKVASPVKLTLTRSVGEPGSLQVKLNGTTVKVAIAAKDTADDIAAKLKRGLVAAGKGGVTVELGRSLRFGAQGSQVDVIVEAKDAQPQKAPPKAPKSEKRPKNWKDSYPKWPSDPEERIRNPLYRQYVLRREAEQPAWRRSR